MKNALIIGAAAIGLSGCALTGGSADFSTADCPDRPATNIVFWWETPALQPGEAVTLTPYYTERPGMMEALPPACVTGASLSPKGAASLGRDELGGLVVTIDDNAPTGPVRIEATYARAGSVRAHVNVYDAAAAPLTGRWRQEDSACAAQGAEPIRELIFEGDGEFSVTWTPFETYKDYWGRYTYDPASGALTLEPESGNQIPGDIKNGTVVLSEDGATLTLETASFGTPRTSRRCTAPFVRGR
ncbi:MAG: hypothetical protein ABL308_12610 [Oceanicaulis sp.]